MLIIKSLSYRQCNWNYIALYWMGNEKPKAKLHSEASLEEIRDFCVRGLSESIPEFMTAQQAENILVLWFPGDTFALEALYRRISAKGNNGTAKQSR